MDHDTFDRLARVLGTIGTRRAALGAVLGTALAGTLAADAAKQDRKKRRNGKRDKDSAQVSAQAADCLSPGPSSNMSGCDFDNADFSGDDLSGSTMVATLFRNAELVGTDLSSSNARGANFRDANLCGADLSSSTLRNATFRDANLTQANLRSSGCAGAVFTGATFCRTIGCDGKVINPDCTGCCTDAACGPGALCVDGVCEDVCDETYEFGADCQCTVAIDGETTVCVFTPRVSPPVCSAANPTCPEGTVCVRTCRGEGSCFRPCLFPADCACGADANPCTNPVKCGSQVSPPAA